MSRRHFSSSETSNLLSVTIYSSKYADALRVGLSIAIALNKEAPQIPNDDLGRFSLNPSDLNDLNPYSRAGAQLSPNENVGW